MKPPAIPKKDQDLWLFRQRKRITKERNQQQELRQQATLKALADTPPSVCLSDLCRATGLRPGAQRRTLRALDREGLVMNPYADFWLRIAA